MTLAASQSGDLRTLRLRVTIAGGAAPVVSATEPATLPPAATPPLPTLTEEQRARVETRARAVRQPAPATPIVEPLFVLNLRSATTAIDITAEGAGIAAPGQSLYVSDVAVEQRIWHRLRLGFFETEADAEKALAVLDDRYPDAWVTRVTPAERSAAAGGTTVVVETPAATTAGQGDGSYDAVALLAEARAAIIDGNFSRAVELAARALVAADAATGPEARELLGLARERNGQAAHAVAEYRRYLADYPDAEGADRVRQRLAALTTARDRPKPSMRTAASAAGRTGWDAYGGVSQYYRRDSLDFGGRGIDVDLLMSDGDVAVRHSGERFDFGARASLGYDYDLSGGNDGPGSQARVYNAYLDIDDDAWRVSARLGRQTLRNQGALGRFDGALLSWRLQDDYRLNLLTGFPVYLSRQGLETGRVFYGTSLDILRILDLFDVNVFVNVQQADGIIDRQAVGGEARYFGASGSLVTAVDFDVGYSALNSLVLLGNWTFAGRTTVNAMFDWRKTPYLTTENALIGQPAESLDELLRLLTEDEIRRLAEDRTGSMQTVALGVARPVSERFQVSADVTLSRFQGTPESGGVPGTPDSGGQSYYYLSLIGSSLLREGDMSILGLRYSDGASYRTATVFLDTRYPLGNALRLNPRLLVSRRELTSRDQTETLLRPEVRLLYRLRRNYQFELDVGGELGRGDASAGSGDSSSYFIYAGYRADF